MLIGSVLSSTDAASVFNILRTRRLGLKYNTSSLLEMESGSNDPVSYMLTVLFASLLTVDNFGAGQVIWIVVKQIGIGAAFGAFLGFGAVFVLRKLPFGAGQGGTIFVFAVAILSYSLPQIPFLGGNGYLAAYITGIIIGNARIDKKREIVKFFDSLTGVAQMMIFFLLGLLATPEWLIQPQVLIPALLVFVFMTLVARPVAVAGLLAPFRAKINQIGVVSWAGLRGVASVVFAIFAVSTLAAPAGTDTQTGSLLPYDLFSIVFVIVIVSILVQGTLLPFMSRKMHMLGDSDNVLRTFNDFQEESDVCFVKVVVGKNHPWAGKKLKDCVMPREFLVVLLLRGNEVIVPNGNTDIGAGDVLVTAAPEFENRENFGMYEEYLGKAHPWAGKLVRELELPAGWLIAMIKRKGGTVIPYGATRLSEGDTLVCIRILPKEERKAEEPAAGV